MTLAVAVALLTASGLEGVGHAQTTTAPSAESLFERGSRLLKAGQYDAACPLLEQAQSRVVGIGVTLYLAECYEQTGRATQAWREFDRARTLASLRHDGRAVLAARRADTLLLRLPKLRIGVSAPTTIEGLTVVEDGATLDRDAWDRARPVDPGRHVVRATAPGHEPFQIAVDIPPGPATASVEVPVLEADTPASGDSRGVALAPATAPAPAVVPPGPAPPRALAPYVLPVSPPAPPASDRAVGWQRIAGFSLLGLGAIGVGTGAFTGLAARSKLADSNANGHCGPDSRCDATGLADQSTALANARLSTVGFIGGAACLVGGGALLLTAPKAGSTLIVAPRAEARGASVVLDGRW